MAVISPFAFDIMTYCNQPQWFSAHNYIGVFNRFRAENGVSGNDFAPTAGVPETTGAQAGSNGPNASDGGSGSNGAQNGANGDFVSIVATVNLTKHTGEIKFVDHVGRAADQGAAAEPARGGALRGRRGQGPRHVPDVGPRKLRPRPDAGPLIAPGWCRSSSRSQRAAASLELVLEGKVVSRRAISKHAPVVKALKISDLATLASASAGAR